MYQYILALLCCYNSLYACDFCGCSPTVMNSDVLSIQPQSSVGTSLQYRYFKHLKSDINAKRTQILSQNFFVSYAPKKWVDIRVSLPIMWIFNDYVKIDQNTPKLKEKRFGVSDMLLFSNFRVWQRSPIGKKTGHVINLGYGMSFPTGSKKSSDNLLLQDFNFGTQTVGFLFSGAYSLSIRNWGLVNSAYLKINIKNKDQVKYGNQYTYLISANYTAFVKSVIFIPTVGLGVNFEERNVHNNIIQPKSGAWNVVVNYGLQCSVKNISIALSATHPVAQKTSAGEILQKPGFNMVLKYQIPQLKHNRSNMETVSQNQ